MLSNIKESRYSSKDFLLSIQIFKKKKIKIDFFFKYETKNIPSQLF